MESEFGIYINFSFFCYRELIALSRKFAFLFFFLGSRVLLVRRNGFMNNMACFSNCCIILMMLFLWYFYYNPLCFEPSSLNFDEDLFIFLCMNKSKSCGGSFSFFRTSNFLLLFQSVGGGVVILITEFYVLIIDRLRKFINFLCSVVLIWEFIRREQLWFCVSSDTWRIFVTWW